MTSSSETNQVQNSQADEKQQQKEHNFRLLERRLQLETQARMEAEKRAEELARAKEVSRRKVEEEDEDDDAEPYIDKKKLNKQLNKFGQSTQQDIQKAMEQAKLAAKEELKQELWLENNPDFYETLEHAEKFAQANPRLAQNILRMPEGFERQKLVYENIKALGIDKPVQKQSQSETQQKIDANRTKGAYQPSGVGMAPYSHGGDFSEAGKKAAFDKVQALKKNLRI